MFKHFLLSFWKTLRTQKVIAAINIVGLAIGLCVFILISLYVREEYSWERHWDDSGRIVRLVTSQDPSLVSNSAPAVAMPLLRDFFVGEFTKASSFLFLLGQTLLIDDEVVPQRGILFVDRDFIDIFDLVVVAGSLEDTLRQPHRVALVEETARLYFGDEVALGRVLTLRDASGNHVDYVVTAVYRMPEGNTSLPVTSFALADPTAMPGLGDRLNSWTGRISGWHYFLLAENANLASLNERLADFVDQHVPPANILIPQGKRLSDVVRYEFQRLTDIHFNPVTGERGGDQDRVAIFAGVALLVLLLGTTNFMILSLAGSVARKHEIGIRKAAGASASQLALQLVGESLLYTLLALLLALAMVELTLPWYSALTGLPLAFSWLELDALYLLLAAAVGIMGGSYPALVLAGIKPLHALKPEADASMAGAASARTLLVMFQFTITLVLIIATLALYLQLTYLQSRDHGFNPGNTLAVQIGSPGDRRQALVDGIVALPGMELVSEASRKVNSLDGMHPFYTYTRTARDTGETRLKGIYVGYDFFDVYQIPVLAGRVYDRARDILAADAPVPIDQQDRPAPVGKTVLNLAAVHGLGFSSAEEAVGSVVQSKTLNAETGLSYKPMEIIGVIADSQFLSLREAPGPEAYVLEPDYGFFYTVRFEAGVADTISASIGALWRQVIGPGQVPIEFAEQNIAAEFAGEENDGRLLLIMAVLSIFVSCLGLYGLVAFEAKRCVKEIGVRKVLGGDFRTILALFLWQFSRPVLLANLVAWPLALWGTLNWLQRFPYQFDYLLLIPLCLSAGLMTLLIAWLTVGGTAIKAASAKPVLALRHE